MSKKTRHKLFEIRKYRAVWAIKSPFTRQIIPAGNIGNVTYLVEYRGIRKYHGQYDAYVYLEGALDPEPEPPLAGGEPLKFLYEDEEMPDPDLSAYWVVTTEEDEYGEAGYVETTSREYPAKTHNFKLDTATPTIVEAAYMAALEALPEGERQKRGTMHLVVLPTEQLNEQLNGSTND